MKILLSRGTYQNRIYRAEKECKICGKKFLIKSSRNVYCSKECKREYLRGKWNKWYQANKEKYDLYHKDYVANHPEQRKETTTRYSRKMGCVPKEEWIKNMPRGEKHHWWNGGHTSRIDKPEWATIRLRVWKRDKFRCQHCNKRLGLGDKPDTHHIIPWDLLEDNSDNNLITLCNSCHLKEHWRMKKENLAYTLI
jgi:5-methylcytosine-specific restriction endonuclease McrA